MVLRHIEIIWRHHLSVSSDGRGLHLSDENLFHSVVIVFTSSLAYTVATHEFSGLYSHTMRILANMR